MARRTSWLDIIPIFVLFLIFLAVALGALYFLWNTLVDVPDLVYDASPMTESSDGSFLVTVAITNESSIPAHLVTFWLHDLGASIEEFEVESASRWEQVEGGKEQDNLLIKWERLADRAWARVRFKTLRRVAPRFGENFFVDSDEGAARDKSYPPQMPWRGQVLLFVFVCAGFISLILSPLTIGGILDKFTS
jgi:hypothetical protein